MARPKANIDWDIVDSMLEADCEGTEIAARLCIHPDTLYNRCQEDHNMGFSDYLRQKKGSGNVLLKMAQFDSAIKDKNIPMQIWLGKQRLGQKDKIDTEHSGEIKTNPTIIVFKDFKDE